MLKIEYHEPICEEVPVYISGFLAESVNTEDFGGGDNPDLTW